MTNNSVEEKLIGQKFGYLIVVGEYESSKLVDGKRTLATILCKCDCGSPIKRYAVNNIKYGKTKSCGCFALKTASETGKIYGRIGGMANRKYSLIESIARDLYSKYMKRSPGNLSFEVFLKLTRRPCYYCNDPPAQIYKNYGNSLNDIDKCQFIYNGLDRIDITRGYDTDNIITCCKVCNFMRHTLSMPEFYDQITKICKMHPDKILL